MPQLDTDSMRIVARRTDREQYVADGGIRLSKEVLTECSQVDRPEEDPVVLDDADERSACAKGVALVVSARRKVKT